MEEQINELAKFYYSISFLVRLQAEPNRYNWIGYSIAKNICILKNISRTTPVKNPEVEKLLKLYLEMKTVYINNHPWKEINIETVKSIFKNDDNNITKSDKKMKTEEPQWRRIGWLLEKEVLLSFYEFLFAAGKINCIYEIFFNRFLGNEFQEKKIKWLAGQSELGYLVSEMINRGLLPAQNTYIYICTEHFCKIDDSEFDSNSLRTMKSRVLKNEIDDFIKKLIELLLRKN